MSSLIGHQDGLLQSVHPLQKAVITTIALSLTADQTEQAHVSAAIGTFRGS